METYSHIDYVVRVKLPESSHYHSSPSGDSEFDEAYRKALGSAVPAGFAIKPMRPNEKWAKDSEGRSMVILCRLKESEPDALLRLMEENENLRSTIKLVRDLVK
jgi:hypothetical protein